jgi:prefoldin subunit 5
MSVERELATHSAEIRHIQDDMDKMMADMSDIKKSLEAINLTLSEAKGGWKTLMWVAGASSAVTSFFIGLYAFFQGR